MGQRPKELTPHKSIRHYWGAELRTMRVARGMSLAELSRQLHCDPSYLAKIERAERPVPQHLAADCDVALNANGALLRLHEHLTTRSDQTVTEPITQAAHVANLAPHVANQVDPLPLNVGERAPLDASDVIVVPARASDGRVIYVSVSRRLFLQGAGSAALSVAATLPHLARPSIEPAAQAALTTDVNPVAHFRQMRRVLIDSDNLFGPQRVIPTVQEQITIMQRLRQTHRGADQRELLQVQTQFAEFCGWLHQDMGDHQAAQYWTDRALEWSHMAQDPDLTVYILARKAQLAGDMHLPNEAVDVAEAALVMAPRLSRLAAVAATYAAHGHSLSGDHTATERAYDRARDLLGAVDPDHPSTWGVWLDEPYIAVQRARSMAVLGNYYTAAAGFQAAIGALPGGYTRDRGVYLARAALAHAGDRDIEQAAALGLEALTIGAETGSGRIMNELVRLDDTFGEWIKTPGVADFRSAMSDTLGRQV